jgi:hypothetical protein
VLRMDDRRCNMESTTQWHTGKITSSLPPAIVIRYASQPWRFVKGRRIIKMRCACIPVLGIFTRQHSACAQYYVYEVIEREMVLPSQLQS